jgi:hypothetical protein
MKKSNYGSIMEGRFFKILFSEHWELHIMSSKMEVRRKLKIMFIFSDDIFP